MDWAPVKREADGETAPANRGKAPRTEQGKETLTCRPTQASHPGGKGRHADGPHQTQMIKALARLALQHETALKILRQDYSWVLFVQPGIKDPSHYSLCGSPKVEEGSGGEHNNNDAQNGAVRLIQMLHTGLKDIGSEGSAPFQKKAEEMKRLKDGLWSYQKWSPALGSLVADEARAPLPHTKLMEALMGVLPYCSCSPT